MVPLFAQSGKRHRVQVQSSHEQIITSNTCAHFHHRNEQHAELLAVQGAPHGHDDPNEHGHRRSSVHQQLPCRLRLHSGRRRWSITHRWQFLSSGLLLGSLLTLRCFIHLPFSAWLIRASGFLALLRCWWWWRPTVFVVFLSHRAHGTGGILQLLLRWFLFTTRRLRCRKRRRDRDRRQWRRFRLLCQLFSGRWS